MTDERKYKDDEVSEIFALAASTVGASLPMLPEPEGLTLDQLQEVGLEVGLSPERVAAAAAALDTDKEPVSRRSWLGVPVSVGRVVELPRAATDREWEVIVAELRSTFGERGRVTSRGDTRVWAKGQLFAFLEPTEAGHRLRLGAHKDVSKGGTAVAASAVAIGTLLLATSGLDAATFGTTFEFLIPAVIASGGGASLVAKFSHLWRWAGKRERQMEHIAGRTRALLAAPAAETDAENDTKD